jgi:hypothetical protein
MHEHILIAHPGHPLESLTAEFPAPFELSRDEELAMGILQEQIPTQIVPQTSGATIQVAGPSRGQKG